MGTDLYLGWRGKTKEDKEAQYTGFDITKGNVGYLRASIGMMEENAVLRVIFPEKYWYNHGKPVPYDFLNNTDLMCETLQAYTDGKKSPKTSKSFKSQMAHGELVMNALSKLCKSEGDTIQKDNNQELHWRKKWALSVCEFFKLGLIKQKEGKKPTIYISW